MRVVKIAKPALSRKALYSRFVTKSLSSPLIVNLEPIGAFGRVGWLDLEQIDAGAFSRFSFGVAGVWMRVQRTSRPQQ